METYSSWSTGKYWPSPELAPSGATPSTSVMNSNRWPFQVKIMGQEPESRWASLMVTSLLTGWFVSFWIRPLGQVMRTVSTCVRLPSRKTSGSPA